MKPALVSSEELNIFQCIFLPFLGRGRVAARGLYRRRVSEWLSDWVSGIFYKYSTSFQSWISLGSDHRIGSNCFSGLHVCLLYILYFQTTYPTCMCTCLFMKQGRERSYTRPSRTRIVLIGSWWFLMGSWWLVWGPYPSVQLFSPHSPFQDLNP